MYISLPFPSAQPSEDHAPFREEPSRNGCIYSGQLHSYSCDAFQPACIHPQSLWGGGLGGARHACLLPNEGEKCIARPSTHQFLPAVVVLLVVALIILIHIVVVIFVALCMLNWCFWHCSQVF